MTERCTLAIGWDREDTRPVPGNIRMIGRSSHNGLTIVAPGREAATTVHPRTWMADDELAALQTFCLQDLLASVMQLSGVSFTVLAPDVAELAEWRQAVPAGVNLVPGDPTWNQAERDRFVFAEAAERGVQQTVILAGDTLALPAATVGTAFGVLESADITVGATRTGDRYLIGAASDAAIETVLAAGDDPSAVLQLASERGQVARRMEPRARLGEVETFDALQDISGQGPRVSAWLAGRRSV
jgi:hypothetical protein